MVVRRWRLLAAVAVFVCIAGIAQRTWAGGSDHRRKQVIVPGEDRFVPFAVTIHVGDAVEWINTDTDDHTVVTNDFFNTGGHKGLDFLLKGTDNNGGIPGKLTLRFSHPGTFVYYCRFHAHLDEHHQPVAPGPDGGIQDASGNFGTPMNGIVTVLED
jgi:plastocyanin